MKIFKSKTTRSLFLLSVLVAVFLASPRLGEAVDEETPTPDATSPAIQKIRDAVKKKVQNTITQIQQGQKRGYAGAIGELDAGNNSFTIVFASKNRETVVVQINEETTILGDDRQEIELDELEKDDGIIAMGYLAADGSLDAARVVFWKKPTSPIRKTVFGEVEDISSDGEKILTIKNKKQQLSHTVEATATTKITKKIDGEVETIKFEEIEKGDRLIAIGEPMQNSQTIISAKIIHIITQSSQTNGEVAGSKDEESTTTPSPAETPVNED